VVIFAGFPLHFYGVPILRIAGLVIPLSLHAGPLRVCPLGDGGAPVGAEFPVDRRVKALETTLKHALQALKGLNSSPLIEGS